MSDGMVGSSHITIPDLLEPVVGFRVFELVRAQKARDAWEEERWVHNPYNEPFKEPNDYVTDPVSGNLIKDYKSIAIAFERWQESLGRRRIIHHKATPAIPGFLRSPTHNKYSWTSGVNIARCSYNPSHGAPQSDCSCGLYSYYECTNISAGGSILLGLVTSWGKIEAHTTGMRSEFMQIHALWGGSILKELASEWNGILQFDCDQYDRNEFVSMSSEFGSLMPGEMRPKYCRHNGDYAHTVDRYGVWRPREEKRKIGKWSMYWLICVLLATNGFWVPYVLAAATCRSRSTPSVPVRRCYPPRDVFKTPLSSPANCLLLPVGVGDG